MCGSSIGRSNIPNQNGTRPTCCYPFPVTAKCDRGNIVQAAISHPSRREAILEVFCWSFGEGSIVDFSRDPMDRHCHGKDANQRQWTAKDSR